MPEPAPDDSAGTKLLLSLPAELEPPPEPGAPPPGELVSPPSDPKPLLEVAPGVLPVVEPEPLGEPGAPLDEGLDK